MTTITEFNQLFGTSKPIIGMIHLKPLPGSPVYDGEGLRKVIDHALDEAGKLIEGGVDGVQVENYNDPSYFPDVAAPETVSSLSIVAHEVHKAFPDTPMGICLLADPIASIAVAHSSGAKFVRATVFTEASVDVSGLAIRRPHEILRYRKFLDPSIRIFADVHIKHSAPLAMRPIEESAYDAAYFLADSVIISGKHTGFETPLEDLKKVRGVLPNYPIMVGSGMNKVNAGKIFEVASGAFVGSTFKVDGDSYKSVDSERVKEFMKVIKEIRKR
ncbi:MULTISPECIES: BtpA/SgcQ family protein [Mesotoga]|uniref:Membrane complex biogenesis protein, BtpA family n=1 Tax=Mesotoga prima MesG1.Ag.4.2 TaxID=660470 RepID=I2F5W3_9BACT|nr:MULTISPECIES: BtpA/SgcQ family protein [Mesotoga]AFK07316.1 membrane complex biogenesis protein, BtpA family [Mesotoga prima MesG1.Ag.4.2]AFK07387.1 membrane complex biogenesis protein, BtpA family [Mesotoga prima MesG1.Ag.4.2]RLL91684.1 hypothetical protein BG32_01635 [Mesotoga sp. HF07.pep.5.2.highcov]